MTYQAQHPHPIFQLISSTQYKHFQPMEVGRWSHQLEHKEERYGRLLMTRNHLQHITAHVLKLWSMIVDLDRGQRSEKYYAGRTATPSCNES